MDHDNLRFDRRTVLAGLVAILPNQSESSLDSDVLSCAEALAKALSRRHGGAWRTHVDPAGITVMMIREFSART